MGQLILLRHGETEWSKAGRHTGLTDLPLTPYGERQASAAGALLSAVTGPAGPVAVVTSPLQRARRTAELAGLAGLAGLAATGVDADLSEWDYGGYEGLTTAQIRAQVGHDWLVFRDGVVPGATPGETLAQVAGRAARVLDRVRPVLAGGDVVLVGHGHALRVLATVWLGRPADLGAQLLLGSGSVSVLGAEHGVPAVVTWNRGTAVSAGSGSAVPGSAVPGTA